MSLSARLALLATLLLARPAPAQEAPAEAATPKIRPPYSIPWTLRPAATANVVKSDTSFAFSDVGKAVTTSLLGAVRLRQDVAVAVKVAMNFLSPDSADSAAAFVNPAVLGIYAPWLTDELHLVVALAATLPVGQGGGNDPDLATRAAASIGVQTRLGMENALFAVNYLTVFGGAGLAYLAGGFTVQGEVTVLELIRVRGDAIDRDSARTNMTTGVHLGYEIIPGLFGSGELHYQRWLSTPTFVDAAPAARDQASFTVGVRGLIRAGRVLLRPGVSYSMAIDDPMAGQSWKVVQLDVPVIF